MKTIMLFFGLCIIALSCTKKDTPSQPVKGALELMTSTLRSGTTYDGFIDIICNKNQTATYGMGPGRFHFTGTLPSNLGLNQFSIKDYDVNINGGVFHAASTIDSLVLKNREPDFWGQFNSLKLNGTSLGQSIYLPTAVQVRFGSIPHSISKSSGASLSFADDVNYSNDVVAVLQYIPDQTGNEMFMAGYPNLITKMITVADDAGAISITPADLTDFPAGSKVMLYLGRGVQVTYTYATKSFSAIALNITAVPGVSITP